MITLTKYKIIFVQPELKKHSILNRIKIGFKCKFLGYRCFDDKYKALDYLNKQIKEQQDKELKRWETKMR